MPLLILLINIVIISRKQTKYIDKMNCEIFKPSFCFAVLCRPKNAFSVNILYNFQKWKQNIETYRCRQKHILLTIILWSVECELILMCGIDILIEIWKIIYTTNHERQQWLILYLKICKMPKKKWGKKIAFINELQ